jgi:hypothetical protein
MLSVCWWGVYARARIIELAGVAGP